MERAKYPHDQINRMIDEEISRIDAANSVADNSAEQNGRKARHSTFDRALEFLRALVRCRKRRNKQ